MRTSSDHQDWRWRRLTSAYAVALAAAGLAVHASAEDFDLDALVEAAGAEGPITVYASTGKIKRLIFIGVPR